MMLKLIADTNLHNLSLNSYPGRGVGQGTDESGKFAVQICWTMGRSVGSSNRVYEQDESRLFTEVADPKLQTGDPATTLYDALKENRPYYVVSNGKQTGAALKRGYEPLFKALESCEYDKYEPDSIHTPRITGRCTMITGRSPHYEFSVLRKSPWGDECDKLFFEYGNLAPGFGRCMTTYMKDGDPPPHWQGEPYLIPLLGNTDEILATYWTALNETNRVSCAVKMIPLKGGPSIIRHINKNKKVELD